MYDLIDLIGTPYVYGQTDCIHLTLTALERMGIDAPPLDRRWYEMPIRQWARDLIKWGERVDRPSYDGDVIVSPEPGFSVVWNQGILLTSQTAGKASWYPLKSMNSLYSHTSTTSSQRWVYRSRNIASLQQK